MQEFKLAKQKKERIETLSRLFSICPPSSDPFSLLLCPALGLQEADRSTCNSQTDFPSRSCASRKGPGTSAFTWAFAATAPVGGPSFASSSRWIHEQRFFPRPLQAQRQYQLSIVPPPFAGSSAPAHHSINSTFTKVPVVELLSSGIPLLVGT